MDRRAFISSVTLALFAAPLAAKAQPAEKVYRIGVLAGVPTPPVQDAFLQGLRERGYVEGKNLALDWRWSMGQPGRFPELAAELVGLKVDLIVVVTNESARAAKQATATRVRGPAAPREATARFEPAARSAAPPAACGVRLS